MTRRPVSSSHLKSVGYEAAQQRLEIEFNDGSLYEYDNVPPAIYEGLMAAASHGSYLHAHIRGRYTYRRIL